MSSDKQANWRTDPVLRDCQVRAADRLERLQDAERLAEDQRAKMLDFDAWLSFRGAEFSEVLTAFRSAFGTDSSVALTAEQVEQAGAHDYLSTACFHHEHDRCRRTCKFCETPCRCDCHVAGKESKGGSDE